ncbi:uncharacterized protein LAESUDRAFT_682226 [Laetiporus sulphureus 93-53]|uniref:Uncharacterized protein n=1 Tax=Laetiporus sulphureus 93-53 TaxID=1314785 RepID=A0A165DEZ4_9APHY|nr:uncharacterized protein LAESUDRAFT_682226 [Laetiporus sulphureus 93-53]KZT04743.1 hypothetical protein LAESUDRAFT_682226 [Laetiporus sulphureus 93-53]
MRDMVAWHLLLAAHAVSATFNSAQPAPQLPLDAPSGIITSHSWDEPIDKDATGNLIFQSLASLMQMMPNAWYPNGHTIVRASIPPGTLLYHGRRDADYPTMDWTSVDPEHSIWFSVGENGTLFTFSTTRELKLLYFDGCSATKEGGVVDTQDVLIYGEVPHEEHWGGIASEWRRLADMCAWGKQYDIDGFIRMQASFEIMYCDFSKGLELVSTINTVTGGVIFKDPQSYRGNLMPLGTNDEKLESPSDHLDRPWTDPTPPPESWKGSPPKPIVGEVWHAGTWHNAFPGDTRVHLDLSSMIIFYDPAFRSLIEPRRSHKREDHRLLNISKEDIAAAQMDVDHVLRRDPGAGSGLDWQSLAQVIQDRFSDRLPYLDYLLHQPITNVSEQVADVRQQVIVSLIPYMPRAGVGEPAWYAAIARGCAMSFTSHLPASRFTKQEHVLKAAVDEVLHEVCRVLTATWREAFDIEEQDTETAETLFMKWRDNIKALIEWLDWQAWLGCSPACNEDEYCFTPQYIPFPGSHRDKENHLPRCMSMKPIDHYPGQS